MGEKDGVTCIYINNENQYCRWGVVNPGLSDHGLIYTCRKKAKEDKEKCFKVIRCYRHLDEALFNADLAAQDWNPVYRCANVNEAVQIFYDIFMSVVDRHMPFKKTSL